MINKLLLLLLLAGASQAQSISASKMPMDFAATGRAGRTSQTDKLISRRDSISYQRGICPLCSQSMRQIYADTVSGEHFGFKAIRVLQCPNGNKVLFTFSVDRMIFKPSSFIQP